MSIFPKKKRNLNQIEHIGPQRDLVPRGFFFFGNTHRAVGQETELG